MLKMFREGQPSDSTPPAPSTIESDGKIAFDYAGNKIIRAGDQFAIGRVRN